MADYFSSTYQVSTDPASLAPSTLPQRQHKIDLLRYIKGNRGMVSSINSLDMHDRRAAAAKLINRRAEDIVPKRYKFAEGNARARSTVDGSANTKGGGVQEALRHDHEPEAGTSAGKTKDPPARVVTLDGILYN